MKSFGFYLDVASIGLEMFFIAMATYAARQQDFAASGACVAWAIYFRIQRHK